MRMMMMLVERKTMMSRSWLGREDSVSLVGCDNVVSHLMSCFDVLMLLLDTSLKKCISVLYHFPLPHQKFIVVDGIFPAQCALLHSSMI